MTTTSSRTNNAVKTGLSIGIALTIFGISPSLMAGNGVVSKAVGEPTQVSVSVTDVQPMALPQLDAPPKELFDLVDPFGDASLVMPQIVPGTKGTGISKSSMNSLEGGSKLDSMEAPGLIDPFNDISPSDYGRGQLNTVYHYTDQLLDTQLRSVYPFRAVGWFVFQKADGGLSRCTAQLIRRSIIATAGHCVHQGGDKTGRPKANGWIRSGTFYPAYANGPSTYGSATANLIVTTSGWYNTGALDRGYDVALVVLNKRSGTTQEIGAATGTLPFCSANCLQSYWYNTQLGYPYNYANGAFLIRSEHLERSDTRDYMYGTGQEGGSSGGPHIANLGSLPVTGGTASQWPSRNVLFAVTSWGYTDTTLKIGGGSSLSGPGNSNNFTGMHNAACTRSRSLHGTGSCSLL